MTPNLVVAWRAQIGSYGVGLLHAECVPFGVCRGCVTPAGFVDLGQGRRDQLEGSANFIGTSFGTNVEIEVHPVS